MQLGAIRNILTIIHQPVTVSSNTCSQIAKCTNEVSTCSQIIVQIKWHSLAHSQGLILTLPGVIVCISYPSQVGIKSCRYARECFICTFICTSV